MFLVKKDLICNALVVFVYLLQFCDSTLLDGILKIANIPCQLGIECCTADYVSFNNTGLLQDFKNKLFGQHLVSSTVYSSIKAHLNDNKPKKPLVLSFHGCSGCGKNYVVTMLVNNLYAKADRSKFVKFIYADVDFPRHDRLSDYKVKLQKMIKKTTSLCERSLFIFDEADHLPMGLLDSITPYLDSHSNINGVNYRKNIFIFLSNVGSSSILIKTLEEWKKGRDRESLTLAEMQQVLQFQAFNEDGGLKSSRIIDRQLIDHFIPFLPLEKEHIKLCVKAELKRTEKHLKPDYDFFNQMFKELEWIPKDYKLYSKSGCKKISHKLTLVISEVHNEL